MASNVPVPAAQAALSLLSLSGSVSPAHVPRSLVKRSSMSRRRTSDAAVARAGTTPSLDPSLDTPESAPVGKAKKGTIFKCETCSKVYRHPNCLVKHRWEHSPHWREASKFLLSKHQQVQMLEAAAILSHISPAKNGVGTSLPEDRSLWPAYLSGGLLPMPGATPPVASSSAREMSVSASAIDDVSEGSSDGDIEREDSGYGSSSAAPPVAVPGSRQPQPHMYATSIGGHEYMISSSHAACDAGAHMGSMAMGRSLQHSAFMARSISASSFGVSSMRGAREDDIDDEAQHDDSSHVARPKWDEDESMAMDMDL